MYHAQQMRGGEFGGRACRVAAHPEWLPVPAPGVGVSFQPNGRHLAACVTLGVTGPPMFPSFFSCVSITGPASGATWRHAIHQRGTAVARLYLYPRPRAVQHLEVMGPTRFHCQPGGGGGGVMLAVIAKRTPSDGRRITAPPPDPLPSSHTDLLPATHRAMRSHRSPPDSTSAQVHAAQHIKMCWAAISPNSFANANTRERWGPVESLPECCPYRGRIAVSWVHHL